MELISGIRFLGSLEWLLPSRIQYNLDSSDFRVSGFSLVGDHPIFQPIELVSQSPVAEDEIYVTETSSSDQLLLNPFCFAMNCPKCLNREMFYPSRLTENGLRLLSFDHGHEILDRVLGDRLLDSFREFEGPPDLSLKTSGNKKPNRSRYWTWDDYPRFSEHDPHKIATVRGLAERIEEASGWSTSRTKNQVVFRHRGEPLIHIQFWAQVPRIFLNKTDTQPAVNPLPTLPGRQVAEGWVWDVPDVSWLPDDLSALLELAENGEPSVSHSSPSQELGEEAFEDGMFRAYEVLKEFDYQANRFILMVREQGGLKTAQQLLRYQGPYSQGFLRLVEMGKLEWSVEAYVLRPEFRHLFTAQELDEARRRLKAAEFKVDQWEEEPWA